MVGMREREPKEPTVVVSLLVVVWLLVVLVLERADGLSLTVAAV